ncbi:MAG: hypothetical protein QOJ00_2526 [Actinomycetota bacterium]
MSAPPKAASNTWAPSLDQLIVATFGLLGLRLGARPIGDNSAFTHLRTGIDMVRRGVVPAIPRRDPYSFTAFHHAWTVQSWLAEFAIGWVNRLGGHGAVIAAAAVAMGGLAWLVATMARTGRPLTTAVAAFAALAVGLPYWSPRPLLVGLLCLAATILIVGDRRSPWLLVPVVWIWVNAHGSFPLGLAWVGATCVGAWIDRRGDHDHNDAPPWPYLGWFVIGLVAACVNPLGPRLLTFAFSAFGKSEVFRSVIEWQSVNFQSAEGVVCLAGLAIAFVVLTRRRLPWRLALPVLGFVVLGLYAQRNMAPLGVVLAPVLASALRRSDGAAPSSEVAAVNRIFAAVLAAAATVFVVGGVVGPPLALADYPVKSIRWLERNDRFGPAHRVATRDTVGNYLELRRGARGDVFFDDRVDMFPVKVSNAYRAMISGGDPGVRALTTWNIDTVLWSTPSPFVDRLRVDGRWTVEFRQPGWVVLTRNSGQK